MGETYPGNDEEMEHRSKMTVADAGNGKGDLLGKSTVKYPDHCRVHDYKVRGQRSTQATCYRHGRNRLVGHVGNSRPFFSFSSENQA